MTDSGDQMERARLRPIGLDRRQALKKLAAGGAIAAGGSLVLSSNAVAQTTSGEVIIGIPPAGEPIVGTGTPTTGYPARLQLSDQTVASCANGSTATVTHAWKINSYSVGGMFPGFTQLLVRNAADTATYAAGPQGSASCGAGCTGYSANYENAATITLKKRLYGTLFEGTAIEFLVDFDIALQDGDSYEVDCMVNWTCAGSPTVTREYRYSGTFPNPPTVTALS